MRISACPITFLFFCLFLTATGVHDGFAQVKFHATLSPNHQQKLNKTKDFHTRLKKYRKLYKKDSTRQAKKFWKEYDSTSVAQSLVPDSLKGDISRIQNFPVDDRNAMLAALASEAPVGYEGERAQLAQLIAVSKDSTKTHPDSLASRLVNHGVIKMEELAAQQVTKMGMGDMQGPRSAKDLESAMTPEELDMAQRQLSGIKSKVPTEQSAITGMAVQLARARMGVLMKKYAYVPNSNDLSTAVKRKSLEGAPLRRRFYFGGNINLASTEPVVINMDFQVGYKFNRDFLVGVGTVFRESFELRSGKVNGLAGDAFGYSFFTNHDLFGGKMFAYGEFQRMRSGGVFKEPEGPRLWQNAILLGVGKEFKLFKFLNMTAMVLYDVNHRNNNLYPSPFVTRIGYRFSELALW